MLTLRPLTAVDEPFMLALYLRSRDYEMTLLLWDDAQKEAFLTMQYHLQRQAYQQQYPQAEWSIVVWEGQDVGRLIVEPRPDEIGLMDITIAPEWRNRGFGSQLIQQVIARATAVDLPVRLHVDITNTAAVRLYQRLGFTIFEESAVDYRMTYPPTARS